MSNYYISVFSHSIGFAADSMFVGLKITVPVIYLIYLLIKTKAQPDLQICIKTANRLLILGGLLFILTILSNVFLAWSSGNEAERDMMIAFATGSHWYQFFFPLLNYALLPIALWFRKWRSSPDMAFYIVLIWYSTYFYSDYLISSEQKNMGFKNEFDYQDYFLKAGLFFIVFVIVYGFEKWKRYKIQVNPN